jgi:hypothetical protein
VGEQVVGEAGSSGSTQVFVDDSGRRRRWVRLAGAGVTTLCAAYIGVVVVGLSQTAVGPLIAVPSGGNGLIAGFPDTSGTVPGLLSTSGVGAVRPVHRAPTPTSRPRAASAAAAARPARTAGSPATPTSSGSVRSVADTAAGADGAKGTAALRGVAAPAHGSGSVAESGRSRADATSGTGTSSATA